MITPYVPQGQITVNLSFQLIIASFRKAASHPPFHAEHLQAISDKTGSAAAWLIRIRELTAGRTLPGPYHLQPISALHCTRGVWKRER